MAKKQQRTSALPKPTGNWVARDARSGRFLSVAGRGGTNTIEQADEIVMLAMRVIGSRQGAARWLATRVPALDGARPKDLLRTKDGAARVREALHQIEHGIFA